MRCSIPNESRHLTRCHMVLLFFPGFTTEAVRLNRPKLNVDESPLLSQRSHLTSITGPRSRNEQIPQRPPRPYSDDPTQWIFHGHPCGSVIWDETGKWTANGSDVALTPQCCRSPWPACWATAGPQNRMPIWNWPTEQREWVRRSELLRSYADKDGIVCIPSVRGEPPAWERLLRLVSAAFGEAWNDGVLSRLLSEASSPDLDGWLRNRFFDQHCKLFRQRPFIWHIWDGRQKDGFHALVNYHKLAEGGGKGRRCLESLTYSYLGDWINRQKDGVHRGEGGAEGRLVAALELQRRLIAILDGEPPFDIFVRWKSIDQQPIGWEPDINDGVRLNIRPFMAEKIPGGRKGAGILRTKPNIRTGERTAGKNPFASEKHSLGSGAVPVMVQSQTARTSAAEASSTATAGTTCTTQTPPKSCAGAAGGQGGRGSGQSPWVGVPCRVTGNLICPSDSHEKRRLHES